MKQVSIFLISFLTALSVHAHRDINASAVTITVNGNKNLQISVDGKIYSLINGTAAGNKTTIAVNNLEMGQHRLQVTRTGNNINRSDRISAPFNLRSGYDMLIKVNGNGSLELIETIKYGVSGNQLPMSNANFNALLNSVKKSQSAGARRSLITNAFNNTNNYFTSSQAGQLLQLVSSENFRLQLAKLSYRTITDRENFSQLFDLLNSQNSRDQLEEYVNNYNEGSSSVTAMSDANFTALFQNIKNQWPVIDQQMSSLTSAFNNTNNYFSTYQAGQLIQLVSAESNRLQLAKLSYRTITDPVNFNQVYNLLNSQSSRNELAAYVNDNYNAGTNTNPVASMSDANFNALYQDIRSQWSVNTQMNSLTNAFQTSSNYFTSYQASQLIQLVSAENNRLQLAKLSYRTITDVANFNQVYNLLSSQASKNELAAFINNNSDAGINPNVAMADANFNALYQTIQSKFFPNEKMNSLTNEFNNTANYFTCTQAKQLIQLVSLESNRLQLAKLSYRTITDRNNFTQLYDILNSQASRNELDAYAKAYKD
jgi:acylphosphatase